MKKEFIFPILLIIMDLCAAIVYGVDFSENWRKVLYWLGAALLTFVVTF